MISRILIEPILRQFDREDRELVLRWRLWKMQWFPYRTGEMIFPEDDDQEIEFGPWKWNKPRRLERIKIKWNRARRS